MTTLAPILGEVRDGMTGLVAPDVAADLPAAVNEVRDAIRNRELVGVGFVNATPGYEGTGLSRAWSGAGGREVIERPVSVQDLFRTVCHSLQIDADQENMSPIGRPIRIVDGGQTIMELFS